jgi:hypothetical protein
MSSAPPGQKLELITGWGKIFDEIEGEVKGEQKNLLDCWTAPCMSGRFYTATRIKTLCMEGDHWNQGE